jgi:hypothetical protein
MYKGWIGGEAGKDKGPVLQKQKVTFPVLGIKGKFGEVFLLYKQVDGEQKAYHDCIVKRQDTECAVAKEPREIMGPAFCCEQPAGDEVSGNHEKEVNS